MSLTSPLDHLITAFEARARKIARELSSRYEHVPSERYVTHFVLLHTDHVQCLRVGDFASAFKLLRTIGRLSQRLEREEHAVKHRVERPKKRLKMRAERFRRGPLICGYVAGDFREFSPMFDTSLSKILAEEPSLLRFGTWIWSREQLDAANVYNRLAENCTFVPDLPQEIVVSIRRPTHHRTYAQHHKIIDDYAKKR